jgi:N4-(beta-N-acetylglucosaminyl)-L-asparaginase
VAAFFRRHSQPWDEAAQGPVVSQVVSLPSRRRFHRPTGTIHCSALTADGDIACTTTTSGLAFKIPGRVGDSPIIGAGLYCDNEVGSCGSTGRGEANLQNQCSFAAVELMRQGASPLEAGMEVLRRVAKTSEPRLLDSEGRPSFGLSFYLLARDGRYAGVSMWGPAKFAVTDASGTRHEDCTTLYSRG